MLYPARPRIKLRLTPFDKTVEIIGWGIVIAMWCIVVLNYSKLPDIIPVHYNSAGKVDDYGDKSKIWVLLIIGSVIYTGMFFLSKKPHLFSYPTKITENNAFNQYSIATKLFRYINLIIILITAYLIVQTITIT